MYLSEEILTFFSKKPNLSKVLKTTNIFQMILFPKTEGKFIQLHQTFQSDKIELHFTKHKKPLHSLVKYITKNPTH